MQRWARQTQCIFCQHRSFVKQRSQIHSQRYHTTSDKPKPQFRDKIDRRKDAPIKFKFRRLQKRSSPKDTIPTAEWRHDERSLDARKRASRKHAILRSLPRVKTWLEENRMNQNSNISQLQGLDQEGLLWPEFESLLKKALEGSSELGNGSGYFSELMSDKTDKADMERLLRFAFLDMVLDSKKINNVGARRGLNMRYPTEWYPSTREIQRVIHLHVGPTNSGKTYNALKRLEQAKSGFYAGPLRLLAHEVYSRFNNRGIKCDLVTGDDVRLDESGNVELYASTVEMVDSNKECDVGVIDEIQMIGDNNRGWAWTRALLGSKAKELHLCGETRVVPLIREIVASMGDTLHIHQYERLNPLKVMSRSLKGNLKNLRRGDCVVAFSIVNIHALKRQIELDTGRRCAIIYGGLPPETRAQQAALFNDPDNDYDFLAASDAIGMGLNLSIKRIVFETVRKFNGVSHEQISIPQIKQIAGRAGRYRTAQDDKQAQSTTSKAVGTQMNKARSIGLVTCLDEADLPILQRALASDGPPLKVAGILPSGEFYDDLAEYLPDDTPFEFLLRRVHNSLSTNPRFRMCDIEEQLSISRTVDQVKDLPVSTRLMICAAPASFRSAATGAVMEKVTVALAKAIQSSKAITVADVPEIPLELLDDPMTADRFYLASLEGLHKALILFLWLSYRFPRVLIDRDMAMQAKALCEEKINTNLIKFSANPKLRQRLAEIRKSSETLREQAKAKGWVEQSPLIMNPDQTVEEIETTAQMDGDRKAGSELEDRVEVDGELDLGDGEVIQEVVVVAQEAEQRNDHGSTLDRDRDDSQERQQATGSA